MKISKYLHACLLIEDNNQSFLFDPGNFSYLNKALDIAKLPQLDYILITHGHADHCHIPFLQELLKKFPHTQIITNPSVQKQLAAENIPAQTTLSTSIAFEPAPHEKLWDAQVPENTAITLLNKITHPGDSLHFSKTAEILALPITAPWGSTTDAIAKALTLKPKVIIPIHDYLWRDQIRIAMYPRLKDFFASKGIEFKGLETGEVIEV